MSQKNHGFTPDSLVTAVRTVFEVNHYEVSGPVQIHGAEVDLVAQRRGDPFAAPIYIEVTVEHVDNDKYGKDVGKLAMIANLRPDAQKLIVSASGFSLPVKERAAQTRIRTLTYDELYRHFEQFSPYIEQTLDASTANGELARLASVYEEPEFRDNHGVQVATTFLTDWVRQDESKGKWLIVVGEYGTGKTAMTKVLQYRWTSELRQNPRLPIPFRIELRDFTRQFDARGLLHHFLDSNQIGYLTVDFVLSMLKSGRVVLLLDGYDEMAQYMHARERRACLEALATLSAGGARGILTSRPNYFSEAEELQVLDVLYGSFKLETLSGGAARSEVIEKERQVDQLLQSHFLDRFERRLRDLSPDQTSALVRRSLADRPHLADTVLRILERVFSYSADGDERSLSGKPVIISYLLEVADTLHINESRDASPSSPSRDWSEWRLYRHVIDQLMLRDFRRSPLILPDRRFVFLRSLAALLSRQELPALDEAGFKSLVRHEFNAEIRRASVSSQSDELERYFSDLRASATLTRIVQGAKDVWRFSHNSLREYLLTDYLLDKLVTKDMSVRLYVISDPMRDFVASRPVDEISHFTSALSTCWAFRTQCEGFGQWIVLLWDALQRRKTGSVEHGGIHFLRTLGGGSIDLKSVHLNRLIISSEENGANLTDADFSEGSLTDIVLAFADLQGSTFDGAYLQSTSFFGANLERSSFRGSFLVEVDLSQAQLAGANFQGLSGDDLSIIADVFGDRQRLNGKEALGYLKYVGAQTDDVPPAFEYLFHPEFQIFDKMFRRFKSQEWSQVRGLVQRGPSRQNKAFATAFLNFLSRQGYVEVTQRRLAGLTAKGRDMVSAYMDDLELPLDVRQCLDGYR